MLQSCVQQGDAMELASSDEALLSDAPVGGRLTVDLDAIRANYLSLSRQVTPATVAAVLKADAYGLGADIIAPELYEEGCRRFFVADIREAARLQDALPGDVEIYMLNGLPSGSEHAAASRGVRPVLNTLDQISAWQGICSRLGLRLGAAIQVDTGMSRLGLSAKDVDKLAEDHHWAKSFDPVLLLSHLACADEPDNDVNAEQLASFLVYAALLPCKELSIANSGGVFLGSAFHADCVRSGVALYGVNPTGRLRNPMRPAIQIEGRVIQLRDIAAGTGVGYGLCFTARASGTLATIGVGYADGWPRSLSGKGAVFFRGQRLPIVGRVSMDSIMVDVTELPRGAIKPDDLVELVGPHQTLEEVARDAGTIAYELLTAIGSRYARTYLKRAPGR